MATIKINWSYNESSTQQLKIQTTLIVHAHQEYKIYCYLCIKIFLEQT